MDTNANPRVTIRIPLYGVIDDRVITPTVKLALSFAGEDMIDRDINLGFTDTNETFPGYIRSWSVEENPRMDNRKELVIVAEMVQEYIMDKWRFYGYEHHTFTYDNTNGWVVCSCGMLGTRVSKQQSVPVSERHVRSLTRSMGSLVREDLN